jgi:MerR family copper efflux transcriptional regulator
MQIGEVADRTRLSLNTLRHYDQAGLVVPSARSQGGFRLYTETDVQRLLTIRRMKPLGFSLEEMRELLEVVDRLGAADLPVDDRAALRDRLRGFQRAAQEQRDKLVEQLSRAQEFIATLQQLDDEAG